MFFFELESGEEAKNFIEWLEYTPHSFPLEFYLNGITYTIKEIELMYYFVIGFRAAQQIAEETDE